MKAKTLKSEIVVELLIKVVEQYVNLVRSRINPTRNITPVSQKGEKRSNDEYLLVYCLRVLNLRQYTKPKP